MYICMFSEGAIRGVDPSAQRPLAIQLDFKTPPPPPSASSERVEQLYENGIFKLRQPLCSCS